MEENGYLGPSIELGTVANIIPDLATPITVPHDTPLDQAIQLMKEHAISQMPVTHDGSVVGLIHERTLLEHALNINSQNPPVGDIADADFVR